MMKKLAIIVSFVMIASVMFVSGSALAGGPSANHETVSLNFGNVTFTGNVSHDFKPSDLIYVNHNTSAWGSNNNVSTFYASYNSTTLFLGFNARYTNNGFMVFIGNNTGSNLGTYNFTNLNSWNRNIVFTSPVNVFFANYAGGSSQSYVIMSPLSQSNVSPVAKSVSSYAYYGNDSVEISMPLNEIMGNSTGNVTLSVSAFIVGGSGSWVGTGIPFLQSGKYNSGNTEKYFIVNNTINLGLHYSGIKVTNYGRINLDIVYNDHQPLYTSINTSYWMLPWAAVHLEEYAEQALIMKNEPNVNVTYSLSGSLLYQIDAIRDGNYNNSYLMTAFIPQSQWNNTIYKEVGEYHDEFLESFAPRYQWNTTTVRDVIEFNLSFNTPSWVYSSGTPAGKEYSKLLSIESSGKLMNNSDLTDALVEFFLWSVSYPIISGQLGSQYENHTLLQLYNQTSFTISDIGKIVKFYPVEAGIAINTFSEDAQSYLHNGNVELMTTPFDHPILPLLLQSNWTDANGAEVSKGSWNKDVVAQLNIGRDIFYSNFGYYPIGQWTPEQAVSNAIVPYLYSAGVKWTSTDQAVLEETGVLNSNLSPVQYMETLYQPYLVSENGSHVYIVFRDATLSNDWGFNYGSIAQSSGNWAAVRDFMSYLKSVYNTVPVDKRDNTLVTVAIDGENWMFESPFPEDAVPFLEDLYSAISQNSSWLNSVTMQQYLSENHTHGSLSYLPTGSWNYQGYSGSVSPYLTQWAGHPTQDQTWIQLAKVRQLVVNFGKSHNLTQPTNLSEITTANDYPLIGEWNVSTLQQRYDEAWFSIYGAEGSDIYFSFDPGDQNLHAQNDIVFEHEVRQDMRNALTVLNIPLTPYLQDQWEHSVIPTEYGNNASTTPPMNGNILNTQKFTYGTGYSVNNNSAWFESYLFNYTVDTGKVTVRYVYNSTDFFFLLSGSALNMNSIINGNTLVQIYFSNINPGEGNLIGLSVPGAALETSNGLLLHYAGEYYFELNTSSMKNNSAPLKVYNAVNGNWTFEKTAGLTVIGKYAEFMVPFSALGLSIGNSVTFSFNIISSHAKVGLFGPMSASVPTSIEEFVLVSSIRNVAPSNGPGNYVYPTNQNDYPPGSVQMTWFNVSTNPDYVEFTVGFKNLTNVFGGPYGFSQPIIDIYIHTSNSSKGNTAMLAGPNADVSSSFDWQWVIQAAGFPENSYIENFTGAISDAGYYITSNLSSKIVNIFVPLSTIGNNVTKYGYVIVDGFQDGYGINGWDPVYASPTEYQGGGSLGPFSPNIFSYIAPYDVNGNVSETQQILLSAYNSTHFAVLPGIYLPKISELKQSTLVSSPKFPVIVRNGNELNAFYYYNGSIFEANSTNGMTWSASGRVYTWGPNITGLSTVVLNGRDIILISGNHRYSLLYGNGTVYREFSSTQTVFGSALSKVYNRILIFINLHSEVLVQNSTGYQLFLIQGPLDNISVASIGPLLYVSYTENMTVNVDMILTLYYDHSFTFIPLFSINSSISAENATLGHISLYVNDLGMIYVGLQILSNSSSNIYLISLGFGGISISPVTSNGLSYYPYLCSAFNQLSINPAVTLVSYSGTWDVYFIQPQPFIFQL
ncbi:MAG: hypothetical protein M1477_01125 [Candidatus Thermoplasmatota archaeon]|nr:hypothetical protein [Candidatus Thermoplasmatota archaeon]